MTDAIRIDELPSLIGLYGSCAEQLPDGVMSDLVIAIAVAIANGG